MTTLEQPPAPQYPPPSHARQELVVRPKPPVYVPAGPVEQTVSMFLGTFSAVIIALLLNLIFVSQLQHATSQTALFGELRLSLAEGSVPVGPVTSDGDLVVPGTPIAVVSIPGGILESEVIVEGTAGAQTMLGIGHRRDTSLPCQAGSSVLMARAAAYGGVGSVFASLQPGARFDITMGQGECTYEITGQRRVGDPAPAAPTSDEGRLTINTALGMPFMPSEVLRIDAELVGEPFERPAAAVPSGSLPDSEKAMGTDATNLFALVLLLELMVVIAAAITWLWRRWSKWQTWIVAAPVVASVGVLIGTVINQWVLPNLL